MKGPVMSGDVLLRRLGAVLAIVTLVACVFVWNSERSLLPAVSVFAADNEDALRARITQLAKQLDAPPIDARKDPVWKAIPGLNGVQVDVEATLRKARQADGQRIPLVAKQIPPQVSLDDLGPLPIYKGHEAKRQVALMINVAWGTEYLPRIMETLETYRVHATFFLDGSWTAKNPALAKTIAQRGHELGNHAYTHPDMAKLDKERTLRELVRTSEAIRRATGVQPKVFAPPSGSYTDLTVQTAHAQGMRTILWSVDTIDWQKPPAATITDRVLSRVHRGALILMHPTEPTADALRSMVEGLQGKGYELVTVSELLAPTRPLPLLEP